MMLLGGTWLLASLLGSPAAAILPATEIRLEGRVVRIGDVARLDADSRDLADRIIARIPANRASVTLSRTALAGLIRRAVPALEVEGGDGAIILRTDEVAPRSASDNAPCFVLANAVPSGALLSAADTEPAPCRAERPEQAVAFDRRDLAVRAAGDLAEGTYLGRIQLGDAPGIARGEELTLASRVGPVTIERSVVAVQPGRAGGRVFVMTEDGDVLTAAVPANSGEGGE